MAKFIPPWLGKSLATRQRELLPDWLKKGLEAKEEEIMTETEEILDLKQTKEKEGNFLPTLLSEIRKNEAGRWGYEAWYGRGSRGGPADPPKPITEMTYDEGTQWQLDNNPPGKATAALGAYQVVETKDTPTMSEIKQGLNLKGDELLTPQLQDRMAIWLLEQRADMTGFKTGRQTKEQFALRIAKIWASHPVLAPTTRELRDGTVVEVARGQSYYVGDGINKTLIKPRQLADYESIFSMSGTEEFAPKETKQPKPKPSPLIS